VLLLDAPGGIILKGGLAALVESLGPPGRKGRAHRQPRHAFHRRGVAVLQSEVLGHVLNLFGGWWIFGSQSLELLLAAAVHEHCALVKLHRWMLPLRCPLGLILVKGALGVWVVERLFGMLVWSIARGGRGWERRMGKERGAFSRTHTHRNRLRGGGKEELNTENKVWGEWDLTFSFFLSSAGDRETTRTVQPAGIYFGSDSSSAHHMRWASLSCDGRERR
jgi:hypothetical protein